MKAVAVIGSNYGDEGKGLMVDYYARLMPDALVVRFNGGAQATHTVVSPDGDRHVFHSYGAGTLAGNDTYLSKHFVLNPLLFAMEQKANFAPKVYADSQCMITTHYDMALNQLQEMRRNVRHGSCGIGFAATIERSLQTVDEDGYYLDFSAYLFGPIDDLLADAADYFYAHAGTEPQSEQEQKIYSALAGDSIHLEFKAAFDLLSKSVYMWTPDVLRRPIIFEGAQGLLLDQSCTDFPHVTRSNTGLTNVLDLLETRFSHITDVTVNYVTRAYLTRHGAGPLPNERVMRINNEKETNVYGDFQHHLRYAPLNVKDVVRRANKDFEQSSGHKAKFWIARTMTCLDQVTDSHPMVVNKEIEDMEGAKDIYSTYRSVFDFFSTGPTARYVHEVTV